MIIKMYNHTTTCLNFSMFDWTGENGNKSGKSQGILISCVSRNPYLYNDVCSRTKPKATNVLSCTRVIGFITSLCSNKWVIF